MVSKNGSYLPNFRDPNYHEYGYRSIKPRFYKTGNLSSKIIITNLHILKLNFLYSLLWPIRPSDSVIYPVQFEADNVTVLGSPKIWLFIWSLVLCNCVLFLSFVSGILNLTFSVNQRGLLSRQS